MTITDELREEFYFLKRRLYENKKKYKRRIEARGQELFDRKNCTLEESIRFRALSNCRTKYFIIDNAIIGNISFEECALRKSTAKDYEKYVDIIFFKYLDEEEFKREKARLYDEFIEKCNQSQRSSYPLYGDYGYDELMRNEYLESIYESKVKGKVLGKNRK